MNHATGMEVVKAVGDTRGFKRYRGREEDDTNKLNLVCAWVNVDVFAWFYATETNQRGLRVMPRKGTMFGCVKCFHLTISR